MSFVPLSRLEAYALSQELDPTSKAQTKSEQSLFNDVVDKIVAKAVVKVFGNTFLAFLKDEEYREVRGDYDGVVELEGDIDDVITRATKADEGSVKNLRSRVVTLYMSAMSAPSSLKNGNLDMAACVGNMRAQANQQLNAYTVYANIKNPQHWIHSLVDTKPYEGLQEADFIKKIVTTDANSLLGKMVRDWEHLVKLHDSSPSELYPYLFAEELAKQQKYPAVDTFTGIRLLDKLKSYFPTPCKTTNLAETRELLNGVVEKFNKYLRGEWIDALSKRVPKQLSGLPKQYADWVIERVKSHPDVVSGKKYYAEVAESIYKDADERYQRFVAMCNGDANLFGAHLKAILTQEVKDFQQLHIRLNNRLGYEEAKKKHQFPDMFAKEVKSHPEVVSGERSFSSLAAVVEFDRLKDKHGIHAANYLSPEASARLFKMTFDEFNSEVEKGFDRMMKEIFAKEMCDYMSGVGMTDLDALTSPGKDDYTQSLAKYYALYKRVADVSLQKTGAAIKAIKQSLMDRTSGMNRKDAIVWCNTVPAELSETIEKLVNSDDEWSQVVKRRYDSISNARARRQNEANIVLPNSDDELP